MAKTAKRTGEAMTFQQAMELLGRDERFKATIYAMNTLLIHKGVYTQEEFERLFVEWAKKEQQRKTQEHPSTASTVLR